MKNEKESYPNHTDLQLQGFFNTPQLNLNHESYSFQQYKLHNPSLPQNLKTDLKLSPTAILGKRAESFFHYYITRFSEEEIIAHNVQVEKEKITVGELDFLLKNPFSGKISHVELVFKFYLYDPSIGEGIECWIGPNRRDTLVKKLERLKSHQFPLLQKSETRSLLNRLEIPHEQIEQKLCFKANLFLPLGWKKELPEISRECIRGFWINSSNFTEKVYGEYQFFSPRKPHWFIPPEKGTTWYSFSEIKIILSDFLEKQKSPLVWMKKNENEYHRFFLVWW